MYRRTAEVGQKTRRLRAGVIPSLAMVLVPVTVEKPAKAAFSGTPGAIAFVSERDGSANLNVYRMNADGDNQINPPTILRWTSILPGNHGPSGEVGRDYQVPPRITDNDEQRRYDMARRGEILDNPVTGQRIIFRQTSEDTGGALLEVESVYTKPTPSRPPVHYHPAQEERFEVLSGVVLVQVGGEARAIREGETLVIPPGTTHEMWAEMEGVRVNWQTRPALKTENFFETVWGLSRDGKTGEKGTPNLLQAAVIAQAYAGEFRLARPPWPVQRVLFAVLATLGRLLGYRASYPEYTISGEPSGSPRRA